MGDPDYRSLPSTDNLNAAEAQTAAANVSDTKMKELLEAAAHRLLTGVCKIAVGVKVTSFVSNYLDAITLWPKFFSLSWCNRDRSLVSASCRPSEESSLEKRAGLPAGPICGCR